jgi:hypothetical protein
MASELTQIEHAIASAKRRRDPIHHAYRAVAFERLFRVHQKDRASSGFVWFALWGVYAVLFAVMALVNGKPGSNGAIVLAIGMVASTFLALRGWVRWSIGHVTKEPHASSAYLKALVNARRDFIKANRKLAPLDDRPQLGKIIRMRMAGIHPKRRQELKVLAWVILVAGGLAWVTELMAMRGRLDVELTTQIVLAITLWTVLWMLRELHERSVKFLPFRVPTKIHGLVQAVSVLVALSLATLLWRFASDTLIRGLDDEISSTNHAWGWSTTIAAMVAMDIRLLLLDLATGRRPKQNARTDG